MRSDLERVFDFNEADLSLNRNGRVSEKQAELISQHRRIRRFGGRIAAVFFFVSIVSIFLIPLYFIGSKQLRKHPEIAIIYVAVFLFCLALFVFFTLLGNLRSDLKSGKISEIEGIAEKWEKKISRNLGKAYYLKIGNEKFQLDEKAKYQAFESNVYYRIFYVRHSPTHIILSVAKITDFQ